MYDKNNSGGFSRQVFLPADTDAILKQQGYATDNYNLKINKLIRFQRDPKGFKHTGGSFSFPVKDARRMAEQVTDAAKQICTHVESFTVASRGRVALGLGTESVAETSMTLHHIYGFPYAPGQALKGITRSYMINGLYHGKEDEALKDKEFCLLFGCPATGALKKEYRGSICFYDAYPIDDIEIGLDIMTPHYSEYYNKNVPPADYMNPVPVSFLVANKMTLSVTVGTTRKDAQYRGEPVTKAAARYLKEALAQMGIGAKTAVGYGRLK
ncbi:hypothetical protein ANRL3_01916 [Anaerolineae bacterium]|nr:hypothetical protein ANRL3_01916 [Anaerolineae bacterium]